MAGDAVSPPIHGDPPAGPGQPQENETRFAGDAVTTSSNPSSNSSSNPRRCNSSSNQRGSTQSTITTTAPNTLILMTLEKMVVSLTPLKIKMEPLRRLPKI